MEGNAISAAFTALWRGLDHDQLSANIAMAIKISTIQIFRQLVYH